MGRAINKETIALIKKFEGCRLTSYQDSVGVWTIGYGHTAGVKRGMKITQAQAEKYLAEDLKNILHMSIGMLQHLRQMIISMEH